MISKPFLPARLGREPSWARRRTVVVDMSNVPPWTEERTLGSPTPVGLSLVQAGVVIRVGSTEPVEDLLAEIVHTARHLLGGDREARELRDLVGSALPFARAVLVHAAPDAEVDRAPVLDDREVDLVDGAP